MNYAVGKTEVLLGKCASETEAREKVLEYAKLGIPLANIHVHPGNNGHTDTYGYVHLGVAVGTKEFKEKIFKRHIEALVDEASTLELLKDPQQQWVFLLYM